MLQLNIRTDTVQALHPILHTHTHIHTYNKYINIHAHIHTLTCAHTQCPHLLEVVVSQQVSSPQHVVVGEVWVQGAGRVGPLPALSDLLGGQG